MILLSLGVNPAMSVKRSLNACTSTPISNSRLVLAAAAVLAPVPPSAIARSVIPAMLPPVILTLFASWVAMLPKPEISLVARVSSTQFVPLYFKTSPPDNVPSVTSDRSFSVVAPADGRLTHSPLRYCKTSPLIALETVTSMRSSKFVRLSELSTLSILPLVIVPPMSALTSSMSPTAYVAP